MLNRRKVENKLGSSARLVGATRFAVPCLAMLALFAVAGPTLQGFQPQDAPSIDAFTVVSQGDAFATASPAYTQETVSAPFEVRVSDHKRARELPPPLVESISQFITPVAWREQAQPASPRAEAQAVTKPTAEQRNIARFVASKYRLTVDEVQRFVEHAYQAAREFRLDPYLVLAIVSIESSFNPNARSSKGAQGLMQVLTRVHTDKFAPFGGATAAFDPMANLTVGSRILKEYIVRDGSVQAALKSYVGAATLSHDYGYGNKVLLEREQIAAAAGGKSIQEAPASPSLQSRTVAGAGAHAATEPGNGPTAEASPAPGSGANGSPAEASSAERSTSGAAPAPFDRVEAARLEAERSERAQTKAAQIDAALAETARAEAAVNKAAEIVATRAADAQPEAAQVDAVMPAALAQPATVEPTAAVSHAPPAAGAETSVALRALSGEIVTRTEPIASVTTAVASATAATAPVIATTPVPIDAHAPVPIDAHAALQTVGGQAMADLSGL